MLIAALLIFRAFVGNALQLVNFNTPEYDTFLTADDFARGRFSSTASETYGRTQYNPVAVPNVPQRLDLFEGDINLGNLTIHQFLYGRSPQRINPQFSYNAVNDRDRLWSTNRIPYTLSSRYSTHARGVIAAAIDEYKRQTCIEFVPRQVDEDYIFISPEDGCYSMVGRQGGRQLVSLGSGCIEKGIIMHELMHVVGFFHEQSRPDRDEHVDIIWQNIMEGMEGQFEKYEWKYVDSLNKLYDYGSVMHYAPTAFARNGQPTILPKDRSKEIGQRRGFSPIDVDKINTLYQCNAASGFRSIVNPQITSNAFCRNVRDDCAFLAGMGYCGQFADWMKENCAETCGLCSNGQPSIPVGGIGAPINTGNSIANFRGGCDDRHEMCPDWASDNLCKSGFFADFLRVNCPKSCGYC